MDAHGLVQSVPEYISCLISEDSVRTVDLGRQFLFVNAL